MSPDSCVRYDGPYVAVAVLYKEVALFEHCPGQTSESRKRILPPEFQTHNGSPVVAIVIAGPEHIGARKAILE